MDLDSVPLQTVAKTAAKCVKHKAEQAGMYDVGQTLKLRIQQSINKVHSDEKVKCPLSRQ